jgi:hypothetical protein
MTTTSKSDIAPDKVGRCRAGQTYWFWTVEQFAIRAGVTPRQVRFYIAECGMPHHGRAAKGPNKLRLSRSASQWLHDVYRRQTETGRKFRKDWVTKSLLDDINDWQSDEAQAYARLYGAPIPADPYLDKHADERRNWKTFKAISPKDRRLTPFDLWPHFDLEEMRRNVAAARARGEWDE